MKGDTVCVNVWGNFGFGKNLSLDQRIFQKFDLKPVITISLETNNTLKEFVARVAIHAVLHKLIQIMNL